MLNIRVCGSPITNYVAVYITLLQAAVNHSETILIFSVSFLLDSVDCAVYIVSFTIIAAAAITTNVICRTVKASFYNCV